MASHEGAKRIKAVLFSDPPWSDGDRQTKRDHRGTLKKMVDNLPNFGGSDYNKVVNLITEFRSVKTPTRR